MPFPADLTLVTVTMKFDLPPVGGASGTVSFNCRYPLQGAISNSIVPPFGLSVDLDASGAATIQLPATNDPEWTPIDWTYEVTARVGSIGVFGTLQLDYATPTVDLADRLQINGAAIQGVTYATLPQVIDLLAQGGSGVVSVNGESGVVTLDKTDIGLPNVDNTSDIAKPVSTAQAAAIALMIDAAELASALASYATTAALALKANLASPTFTGTVSGITAAMVGLGNVNNTSDANKPVSTAQATAIALMIDAAELVSALAAYATLASPTFTGTVNGITKAMVGLGSVDDTSDLAKPVSTLQAASIAAVGFTANAAYTESQKALFSSIVASDHALAAWSFDPAATQGGTVLPTAGLVFSVRVKVLGVTAITNILMHLTTGGVTLTAGQCFAAVYNDAGTTLVGVTADQSTAWASGGLKTMAIVGGPVAVSPYTWYRVVFWFNGTTGPSVTRGSNVNNQLLNLGIPSNFRFASSNAGTTTTPPASLGALTAVQAAWMVGLQ